MTETVKAQINTVLAEGFSNPLTLAANAEDNDHVKVFADNELLTEGVDYTLAGVGDIGNLDEIDGIEATITSPGDFEVTTFTILHDPPLDQERTLTLGGAFGAAFEGALDALDRRLQALGTMVGATIRPVVDLWTAFDPVLPQPVAGKALKWADDGLSLVNSIADADGNELTLSAGYADAAAASAAASAASATSASGSATSAAASALAAENAAADAGDLSSLLNKVVPIGASIMLAHTTVPTGFMKENGAAVSRTTYSALFALLGTAHGAGNGSTTFNLPESRGEFIRGLDDSRGVDTGRAMNSTYQADSIASHTHVGTIANAGAHTHDIPAHANLGVSNGSTSIATSGISNASLTSVSAGDHTHTIVIASFGGTETRPRNVPRLMIIKY